MLEFGFPVGFTGKAKPVESLWNHGLAGEVPGEY